MSKKPIKISVFGSARIQAGTPEYEESVMLGAALAQAGYTVMTGGYNGLMEAASKGAHDAGGHVIGVTVAQLEMIGESRMNPFVREEVRYETMDERLHHLVLDCDAAIVMPGGIGTLQELAEMWQAMRTDQANVKPLLVFGPFWRPVVDLLFDSPYIGDDDRTRITLVDTVEAAIQILDAQLKETCL